MNSRIEEQDREFAYRIYVTESLRNIPQSKALTKNLIDFYKSLNEPVDRRSGEEIAQDVIVRAGLKIKG